MIAKKYLLYGEYWEGTHIDSISKVFKQKKINHEIFNFFPLIHKQLGSRITNALYRKTFHFYNERKVNRDLLNKIEEYKPDVFIISKGINIYPETLKYINKKSIIIVNWNPDDFFNKNNSNVHLLNSINIYDLVFSARSHLFEEYKYKGIKNPVYLEWYYIPWLHYKPSNFLNERNKLTFIGTYSKRREEILNKITTDLPIEIWGDQWQFSKLKYKKGITVQSKSLPQSNFPEIISNSLLNLNILTQENRDKTNLKIFEIPASYGIMLTEYTENTNSIFGNKCFYYNPNINEDLSIQISNILTNYSLKDLRSIKETTYNYIINSNNDIQSRVETILNEIELL